MTDIWKTKDTPKYGTPNQITEKVYDLLRCLFLLKAAALESSPRNSENIMLTLLSIITPLVNYEDRHSTVPGWAQRKEMEWGRETAMDARKAAIMLCCLSRIGYLSDKLPTLLKEKYMMNIGRALANVRNAKAGQRLLAALVDMKVMWEDLPAMAKTNHMLYLAIELRYHGHKAIMPAFHHLRTLKAQWSTLPVRPRNVFAIELAKVASQNVESARLIIGALYIIGASWSTMPKEARQLLLDGLLLGTVEENAKAYVLIERMKARIIPSKLLETTL